MPLRSKFILLSIIGLFVISSASWSAAARLPTVGGDTDSWGTVLNDYLNNTNNSLNSVNSSLTILNNSFGQLSTSLGALAYLNTVTTSQINDGTITGADMASDIGISTSGNIAATGSGTITSAGLLTASNGFTLSSGALTLPAGSIANAMIADNAITASKIAANAVAASEIDTGAVSSDEIQDGSIATIDLADNAVTDAKVANDITASNYLPLVGGTMSGDVSLGAKVLTTSEVKTSSASGTLYLQQNADSSGRVRFFRNTTGNPMINIWGYDSVNAAQKYITIGVFDNPAAFTEAGASSRAIITSGGNTAGTRNALEIQSPDQVRITAVDDVLNSGKVRIAADTVTEIHSRAAAETDSAKFIKFDTRGGVAGGDPTIETNAASGQLNIQPNADSSGRVRFFRDTTGNPMINVWGYDSGNSVQKPLTLGVFNDPAFTEAGGSATARAIITSGGNGANDRNALELQSPSQVRITAVDNVLQSGNVRIAADTTIELNPRTAAETDSAKKIIIDTTGGVRGDGTDPVIKTNAGNLVLDPAGADDRVNIKDVLKLEPRASPPSLPAKGDIYVDSDGNALCFYTGSAWEAVGTGTCA